MAKLTFKQISESAAKSKMRRLVGNTSYGQIGFASFQLKRTSDREVYQGKEREWWIEGYSTYHADVTIDRMYRTNGREW